MSESVIVLYDIPSMREPRAWSYNIWKIRLLLNYKGIPYRTEWVSYPDIEPTFKEMNIPMLKLREDGRTPLYTCPAIIDYIADPNGIRLVDSTIIAHYLDETYASEKYGPTLFPEGTRAAQFAFIDDLERGDGLRGCVRNLIMASVPEALDPRGAAYFRQAREKAFSKPITEVCCEGSVERKEAWDGLKSSLDSVATAYDANRDGEGRFLIGTGVTYADMYLISILMWMRSVPSDRDGPDAKSGWDILRTLNEGRWQRMMDSFDNYFQVK
ncbi:hypothetical protein FRB94_000205 [Tulasnella sp. JGI-2019a]|nr:hypothetical protein FRB94_000205 [Tulasnella sp. JGI-2019a]KAG9015337.1 hypothetical protein FRB93_013037 [Tulasnella sp. JGI-2019a]